MNPGMMTGIVVGMTLAHFFDPDRGRRRRTLARDRGMHLAREGIKVATARSRDTANRMRGWFAEMRARSVVEEVDDWVLADRVRSKLGHMARHPNGIEVQARKGQVILTGWALAEELDAIQEGVMRVPGVTSVIARVQHASPAWPPAPKS